MKKLFSLLLVCLMSFGTVVSAESIDLSSMNLEELIALHKMVDAEINARMDCQPSLIPAGVYIAGINIKAGSYIISTNEEYDDADITVFNSKEHYDQAISTHDPALIFFDTYLSDNESAFIYLSDGMVLLVDEPAIIEVAKADWMP